MDQGPLQVSVAGVYKMSFACNAMYQYIYHEKIFKKHLSFPIALYCLFCGATNHSLWQKFLHSIRQESAIQSNMEESQSQNLEDE